MELFRLDQQYIMPTYAKQDVHLVRGQNATLFDEHNQDYIDFVAGIAVVNAGHAHPKINTAITDQITKLTHISNLYPNAPQARLAQTLVQKVGKGYKAFFANSGAEANEGAIKIARKYGSKNGQPHRFKIITLGSSFHGRTLATLKATGQPDMHQHFGPFIDGFVYAKNLSGIEELIDKECVAVMIELVQGEGGVEVLPKDEVKALEQLCKQRNLLLIVDEIQTGIYRTGAFLASEIYDIQPDIITIAKGLANGVPIGCILTKQGDIMGAGSHGSTFGGNLLSSTAGNATLEVLEAWHQSGDLQLTINYFDLKLDELMAKFQNLFTQKTGLGLMRGLRVVSSIEVSTLIQKALKHKVLVLKAGKNTLRFLPPLTITKEEIDEGFERLGKSLMAL